MYPYDGSKNELVQLTLSFLNDNDLSNAALVCKHWSILANDGQIWKALLLKETDYYQQDEHPKLTYKRLQVLALLNGIALYGQAITIKEDAKLILQTPVLRSKLIAEDMKSDMKGALLTCIVNAHGSSSDELKSIISAYPDLQKLQNLFEAEKGKVFEITDIEITGFTNS